MPNAAALAVHDLKNELGLLEAGLEALAAAPEPVAAAAALERCRDLRRRLVAYLTLYGSGSRLRAWPTDESPSGFLAALAARHAGQARDAHGIALRVDAAGAPPYAHFDRHLVGLALEAALHNARRFARREIVLGLRNEPAHLVFTVDDDGPGLAGEPGLDDEHRTGLGTDLCRAVARAHGTCRDDGGVQLADRPGGGAHFELWLAA